MTQKQVGKTKDAGFQFGIRRTFDLSLEEAWDFLFSDKGLGIWLGEQSESLNPGQKYHTTAGITGEVRVLKPYSHIRITWKQPDWTNTSTLQIRVINNAGKTTISIHQEKLAGADQRTVMSEYWNVVMDNLRKELAH